MRNWLARLEHPLMSLAGTLGQQPHLNAIRDGVVGALPLLIIGSIFMLVAQPPLGSQRALDAYAAQPFVGHLFTGYNLLIGLVGVYVAFSVAHSLARRRDLDALSAGLLSVAALFLINGMFKVPIEGMEGKVKVLPMLNLGSGGLFLAIIIGLLVPEVQRLTKKWGWEIRMPAGVPPAVGRSFSALIPGVLILGGFWALTYLGRLDLFALVNQYLSQPIRAVSVTGPAGFFVLMVQILIDSVVWLFGIHATAILFPMQAIWTDNITNNSLYGTHFLNTRETLQFFIWIGGSGATVVLPFLLLRAKSLALRAVSKVALVPAIFNINEPLIFGVPVMLNPVLMVPFILAPLAALTTTVIATHAGLVPVPHMIVPWTLPGPIGAYLSTGGSWPAALLSAINIVLAALIYWPFVHALDRRMAAGEAREAPADAAVATV